MIPVVASGVSVLGKSAELRVFADADPALQVDEIVWTTPIGEWVRNGSKFRLTDLGRRLVISNMGLGEHGQFEVSIIRRSLRGVFTAVASAFITTQIHGTEVHAVYYSVVHGARGLQWEPQWCSAPSL